MPSLHSVLKLEVPATHISSLLMLKAVEKRTCMHKLLVPSINCLRFISKKCIACNVKLVKKTVADLLKRQLQAATPTETSTTTY